MGSLKLWIAVLGVAALGACQQTDSASTAMPQEASATETIEATAIVKLVDLEERQVLIELENGRLQTILAGPDVRNLEQVEPGDTVRATYKRGVAVKMVGRGEESAPPEAVIAAGRAAEGERPAAMVGDAVRLVVRIVSYDADSNLVAFSAPDGFVHSVVIQEPEIREFARGLKAGDEVEVTFTEALAVAVVETPQ